MLERASELLEFAPEWIVAGVLCDEGGVQPTLGGRLGG